LCGLTLREPSSTPAYSASAGTNGNPAVFYESILETIGTNGNPAVSYESILETIVPPQSNAQLDTETMLTYDVG
jgi:hypothetical protein